MAGDGAFRRLERDVRRVVRGQPDLLSLFEHEIQALHISEGLHSCRDQDPAGEALARMGAKGFDVLGIRTEVNGRSEIYGYVHRADLGEGICGRYARPFQPSELIADTTPLIDTLEALREQERVFTLGSSVYGIVTRADLQKAPVRLLLFGLMTSLETAMLTEIRRLYPGSSWKDHLSRGRLIAAEALLQQRRQRNEEIDLPECLQFCDKRAILLSQEALPTQLGFGSKRRAEDTLKAVEGLRDRLAHAQDLVIGSDWPTVIALAGAMEHMIERLGKP